MRTRHNGLSSSSSGCCVYGTGPGCTVIASARDHRALTKQERSVHGKKKTRGCGAGEKVTRRVGTRALPRATILAAIHGRDAQATGDCGNERRWVSPWVDCIVVWAGL